jgi:hypothetical protein
MLDAHLTARNVPPSTNDAGKSIFCSNFKVPREALSLFALVLCFLFDFLGEVDTLPDVFVELLDSGRVYTNRLWVVANTS